jgi:hypothetical protein
MSIEMIAFGLLVAGLFVALYWIGWLVRWFIEWTQRRNAPRERRWVLATASALVGFVVGAMAYEPFLRGLQCHEAGQPIGACIIQPSLASATK